MTDPRSTENQVALAAAIARPSCPRERRVFLFVNVSAIHQPNCFYLPGRRRTTRSTRTPRRWRTSTGTCRRCSRRCGGAAPWLCVVCSDHGTAYGEDGYTGHRLAHPVVWTVPYAEFVLPEATP